MSKLLQAAQQKIKDLQSQSTRAGDLDEGRYIVRIDKIDEKDGVTNHTRALGFVVSFTVVYTFEGGSKPGERGSERMFASSKNKDLHIELFTNFGRALFNARPEEIGLEELEMIADPESGIPGMLIEVEAWKNGDWTNYKWKRGHKYQSLTGDVRDTVEDYVSKAEFARRCAIEKAMDEAASATGA